MRTTGKRKKTSSRSSAGAAGQKPLRLENMDRVRIDADGNACTGSGQSTARGLADQQLEPALAGKAELERGAEIDRLDHLARELVGAFGCETLRAHQDTDLGASWF